MFLFHRYQFLFSASVYGGSFIELPQRLKAGIEKVLLKERRSVRFYIRSTHRPMSKREMELRTPSEHFQQQEKTFINSVCTDALLQSEKDIYCDWQDKFSKIRNYHEAIFVLGPMGSGKTSTINNELKSHKLYSKYAYVDTDEIMELLHGFKENSVDIFYPIARRIAIKLTDWLLEERISFVAEGTCVKHLELEEYMSRLKEKHYKIRVKRIDGISCELAVQRSRNRSRRRLPDEVVKNIYINSIEGIFKLYELNATKNFFMEF
ncbi:uncharacterized protein LOC130623927 [Hydractinia symbiolongicarpus]|uniref:uncharacterized protein LOC130623927 n=1 Tax=Hydractinia symbiolongicarpus TaxID=13093 RepID=UPI00254C31EA|nr:uncharacterized protein LOC130623927 [Hydractinia symbiolongicarpus]